MVFDNFTPLQKVPLQKFSFESSRYEIWKHGAIIKQGEAEIFIYGEPVTENGLNRLQVKIQVSNNIYKIVASSNFLNEILTSNIFDEFITENDRLQLVTIPAHTSIVIPAFTFFKVAIGATRPNKDFSSLEPYCCNLFLQDGVIKKVTFTFSNPEKLIEFFY